MELLVRRQILEQITSWPWATGTLRMRYGQMRESVRRAQSGWLRYHETTVAYPDYQLTGPQGVLLASVMDRRCPQ